MSIKRPSYQYYPGDKLANINLRRCTWDERGVWWYLLDYFHESEEYGMLRWTLAEISEALGCKVSILQSLAKKKVLKGADKDTEKVSYSTTFSQKNAPSISVKLIDNQPGPLWFSSRMLRDEYVRIKRGSHGHKSLNNMNVPRRKGEHKDIEMDKDKGTFSPSPSSSSSSSATVLEISDPNKIKEELEKYDPFSLRERTKKFNQKLAEGIIATSQINFDHFRELYPKPGNWQEAQIAWVQKKCDDVAQQIFDDIPKRLADHANWKQGAKFILNPENYLKREEWKNAIIPEPTNKITNGSAYSGKTIAQLKRERAEREAAEQGLDRPDA